MTSRTLAAGITAGAAMLLLAESTAGPSVEEAFVATAMAAAASEREICVLPPDWQDKQGPLSKENYQMREGDTTPVRMVFDPFPSFNGVALDPAASLVVFSDTNRKSLLTYPQTAATAGGADVPEPLRQVMGPDTGIGFVAGVLADPEHRELLTVNNDVEDRMVAFDYDARGNAKPKRTLYVPHQSWGVALSKKRDEIAFTVQTPNMVIWYKREAKGLEPPVRVIRGPKTTMADPHGIAIDDTNDEVFVANHGNWRPAELITSYTAYDARQSRQEANPARRVDEEARGRFRLGSVTVFQASAAGDVPAKRTIAGPLTQLDWPMGLALDVAHDEIAVASNGNDAILFFRRTAEGNVQPTRVIRGARTGIRSPMGVAIHGDEVWVANFGEHTALVFPRTAAGNVAPARVLRNAPRGTPTTGVGNPYAVAYDSKRKQLLVPN